MRLIHEPAPEMYSIAAVECWYEHIEREQEEHFYGRNWVWADWAMVTVILGFWTLAGIWALERWVLR